MSRQDPTSLTEYANGLNADLQAKREYWRFTFAAAALQGILANDIDVSYGAAAANAREHADALLAELEAHPLAEKRDE